jgi:hypothetical protein
MLEDANVRLAARREFVSGPAVVSAAHAGLRLSDSSSFRNRTFSLATRLRKGSVAAYANHREHNLAKVGVVGSNPIARSKIPKENQ